MDNVPVVLERTAVVQVVVQVGHIIERESRAVLPSLDTWNWKTICADERPLYVIMNLARKAV